MYRKSIDTVEKKGEDKTDFNMPTRKCDSAFIFRSQEAEHKAFWTQRTRKQNFFFSFQAIFFIHKEFEKKPIWTHATDVYTYR